MIKVALCDDELKILDDLTFKVKTAFENARCEIDLFKTDNPIKLLEYLKSTDVDVLFLDIDMPKISGMDIAENLLNSDMKTLLVFVTSHDALVYKSFKYHPFGFIRKAYFDEEISSVVNSAVDEIRKRNDTFSFKTNDGFYIIKLMDILYFDSESNYVNVHTADKIYKFRGTLSAIEKELVPKGFIRTHKGFLVNQKHIYSIKSDDIVLSDKEVLPIGRTNRESVKALIMRCMR
ncbi:MULTISPECIES: LytTR family DNA-binding domain-containing protein [unclassified Ruminococcus]|uniref:LytR/AlgR family response regulator transcription factor n=1 Tax=unclassified Ruminococcus TaxID=2608920 RepID=UPI002108AEC8|nr:MULTISPECIES: LytTR family DNA-binding domain-containing protein [unclassified Ruminococcus]MCQ4022125.1 response regulator [Ruminococcus sp. zg-924]MCQ4114445.1 response regulator [Ruminococcus sp. zg-921]